MTATVSNLTGLLNQVTPQLSIDAVEAKRWFMDFFPRRTQLGDTAVRWKVRTTGNTGVENFVEGQALPTPGAQTYTAASEAWGANRAHIRISRFALEDERDVSVITGIMARELADGEKDLVNDMADDVFSGAGTGGAPNGLTTLVDSAGTHHGIDKGVITAWASYEAAVAGIVLADLDTAIDNLITPARTPNPGGPTTVLLDETEFRVVGNLMDANERHVVSQADARAEGGLAFRLGYTALFYDNLQIVRAPGFPADTVLLIDQRDWEIVMHRDFLLDPFQLDADEVFSVLSTRWALKCNHLGRQGKLTGA